MDMFGAEHHQFLQQSDEIKWLRCETLACRMPRVSRQFEFGGVFYPTGSDSKRYLTHFHHLQDLFKVLPTVARHAAS